jgi:hypothetical protein
MKEIVQLNRFSQKLMGIVTTVVNINETARSLALELSQENIEKLAKLAELYQTQSEDMQSCCISFLKEITASEDAEEIEVDANETDMGYKL